MKRKKEKRKKRSTVTAARRRSEEHKTGFETTALSLPEGAKLFALKSEKAVRLDILPYAVGEGNPWADEGELHYERTYFVHRGLGVDNSSYVCLQKTAGKKCPVCEYRTKLTKDPKADEELIKNLGPKERQLFNIIDTQDRDKGVQIWDISFHLFGKALDARIRNRDDDDNYDEFSELENGSTLKLGIEEGHYGKISFFEVETIDFKSRKEDYDEDILDEVYNLDEIIDILPYEELKKILLQTEEEDEEPKSKKSKSKKKKKEEEDLDDDDDDFRVGDYDDDDEDDEDDDKPKSKKSKSKKKKKKDDDLDDDDIDEDEDDDDDLDDDDIDEDEDDDFDDMENDIDDENADDDEGKSSKKKKKSKEPKKKSSKGSVQKGKARSGKRQTN